jgi:hypothetical protein
MPVSVWAATTSVIPPWAASASPALMVRSGPPYFMYSPIPHWPLPAVRDLTRDGRLSAYDESVLKMSKVSFRGKCARMVHPLTLPSLTKLARLCRFPPASRPSVIYFIFSLYLPMRI